MFLSLLTTTLNKKFLRSQKQKPALWKILRKQKGKLYTRTKYSQNMCVYLTTDLYLKYKNNPYNSDQWGKDLDKHFAKEYTRMAKQHMQRCPTLLVRKIQIKTMRLYTHQSSQHYYYKTDNTLCGWGCGGGTLIPSWWGCEMRIFFLTVWQFLIKVNTYNSNIHY